MPFIEAAIGDAKESEVVPEGTYSLRNHSADIEDNKKGTGKNLVVLTLIESADHPNAAPIKTYFSLPNASDDEKTSNFKLLQIRRFCELFEVPFEENGFDSDDIPGTTADCLVVQDSFQPVDETGQPTGEPRTSNKMSLPHLVSEPEEERLAPPKGPAKKQAASKKKPSRR